MQNNYVLQSRDDEFIYSNDGKEIGIIMAVKTGTAANLTNENLKKVYLHSQDIPIRLYDVKLISRDNWFYDIPAFLGKNDITIFEEGDMVLIDYLASPPARQPFIVSSVQMFTKQETEAGGTPPINSGERYIQTSCGNSIHLRNDGGVVITGGYSLNAPDGSAGNYRVDNPFHFVIGGHQGVAWETGKPIRITLQDKLGSVFRVDNEGTLLFNRPDIKTQATTTEESISSSKTTVVGMVADKDESRGIYNLVVGKEGKEYFGERLSIEVGDSSKGDNRQSAPLTITVAKDITIESKNGDVTVKNNGRSITLTEAGEIKIGDPSATEPLVLGSKLLNLLSQIYAWGTVAGSAVGVPINTFVVPPPGPDMLSLKNKTN